MAATFPEHYRYVIMRAIAEIEAASRSLSNETYGRMASLKMRGIRSLAPACDREQEPVRIVGGSASLLIQSSEIPSLCTFAGGPF